MPTILITGFGPFPGAPFNPTDTLVRHLARLRRPALADVTLIGHVFETSYAAVDRDLPKLIAAHRPDALLMFGLHGRAKAIRIETRARNALALVARCQRQGVAAERHRRRCAERVGDAGAGTASVAGGKAAHVPAVLSRDAGRYLCNYLCWRAAEAVAAGTDGPRLAAFVHVPPVRAQSRGQKKQVAPKPGFRSADLARAGENILHGNGCGR